ncbi:hypothetical protein CAPTEDRAFT_157424 [Capitella teleta]|uniref:Glutathione S-transferase kappa n=1 Tax=Capitella teleta TaxID=283909 RepID=R7VC67_CAPTE|nr:hypothetical protein CAPTEDRAFT_157424 [Capitella teleta]|eukprot:ELU13911.1 hypothetical protein CAPTEDRAFT_157424 [Capitella teleta]
MASPTKRTVELFYDVISPYTWIAFESLCRHRNVWNIDLKLKPFLLGGVMQGSDNKPPGMVPNKGMYMARDLKRLALHYQLPIKMPANPVEAMFIKGSLSPMRFLTAIDLEQPNLVENTSRSLWTRIWSMDQDITEPASLLEAAKAAGMTKEMAQHFLGQLKSQKVKDRLKQYTEEGLDHGAFGSPTILVEDANKKKQMVFGSDRMHIIADILGEKYEGPQNQLAAKL